MSVRVIVAGGGPAGITAAISAAKNGASVTVLEAAPKPLKKLLMTGNGRCNISNKKINDFSFDSDDEEKLDELTRKYDSESLAYYFNYLGIMTKSRDGWLYPVSDSAAAVSKLLLFKAKELGVKIKTNEVVKAVEKKNGIFKVITSTWTYEADRVIIACGTFAHADKAVASNVFDICSAFQIKTCPYTPALVPFTLNADFIKSWAGVRVQAVGYLYLNDKELYEEAGEFQLTDYGISGIPVFQISRFLPKDIGPNDKLKLILKLLPDIEDEELEYFLSVRMADTDCTLNEALLSLLPEKLIPVVVSDADSVEKVIANIRGLELEITGTKSFDEAQICKGGVSLSELDENLQAVKVPGLYFAGENTNVDGACGGYNLHWAWISGAICGIAAAGE